MRRACRTRIALPHSTCRGGLQDFALLEIAGVSVVQNPTSHWGKPSRGFRLVVTTTTVTLLGRLSRIR